MKTCCQYTQIIIISIRMFWALRFRICSSVTYYKNQSWLNFWHTLHPCNPLRLFEFSMDHRLIISTQFHFRLSFFVFHQTICTFFSTTQPIVHNSFPLFIYLFTIKPSNIQNIKQKFLYILWSIYPVHAVHSFKPLFICSQLYHSFCKNH